MPRKHYKPEEIVAKLRQVDVLVSQGRSVADAVRAIGVTEVPVIGLASPIFALPPLTRSLLPLVERWPQIFPPSYSYRPVAQGSPKLRFAESDLRPAPPLSGHCSEPC